jgi:hypothetical protein
MTLHVSLYQDDGEIRELLMHEGEETSPEQKFNHGKGMN